MYFIEISQLGNEPKYNVTVGQSTTVEKEFVSTSPVQDILKELKRWGVKGQRGLKKGQVRGPSTKGKTSQEASQVSQQNVEESIST